MHIAQAADQATRQVPIAARVDDSSASDLGPGSFARITARLDSHKENEGKTDAASLANKRPAIPESAIRPSEHGFVAFVVRDGKAEQRRLSLGLRTSDGRVEVVSGIATGEALVVRGAEALREGSAVKITVAPAGRQGP
jgi:multidrug efflux system membrane fusion protein